ncbi:hypothetical protein [Hydrogenophaga defluvii]|uniref:hypothetical protein n=1 Tax=Hydrogenophaga defluvii TaxID=249410 RepID=UPI0036D41C47
MLSEIAAATSALSGIKTIIEGFVSERDAAKLQQTRAELFKLLADAWQAVFELQQAALLQQTEIAKLADANRKLESQLAQAGKTESQFQGYDLVEVTRGVHVYTGPADADGARKPPYLCPTCMSKGEHSILNLQKGKSPNDQTRLVCPSNVGHSLGLPRGLWSMAHLGKPPHKEPPNA